MSVEKIKEQVASTKEMLAQGYTFLVSVDCESSFDICIVETDIWDKLYDVGLAKLRATDEPHRDGNGYSSDFWLWFESEADFKKSVADSKVDLSILGDGEWPLEVEFNERVFPIELVKTN